MKSKAVVFIILVSLLSLTSFVGITGHAILFCGSINNDLYALLIKNGFKVTRYDSLSDAIRNGDRRSAVFIVADRYPNEKTNTESTWLKIAVEKGMRIYIEYPDSLPGFQIKDTIIKNSIDRGVVVSNSFGNALKPMSILGINDCHILPVRVDSSLIVFGHVAGFNKAVYGISDIKTYPVLFRTGNEMVAMTKLSNFATGRYEPSMGWKEVWEYIISWMTRTPNVHFRYWPQYVHPTYSRNERLPSSARSLSVKKGIQWYFDAHMFIDSSWEKLWLKYQGNGSDPVGPPVPQDAQNGNGSLGIIEGPNAQINYNGTQQYRYWVRADDQGEVSYALSAAANFLHKPYYDTVAANLINFLLFNSNLRSGEKRNPDSPVFGLIGWAVTHPGVFYGDDNARCMLGVIGASACMHTDKWDKEILENILANFRTTGKEGFRGDRLEENDMLKNGWQYYRNRNIINPHPHFESWLWACYLWLYDKTGYKPLLEKTEKAISITMNDYPNKWKWTNGLQQERARMILPLAWLVGVDNTPEHRAWLNKVVTDLISFQAPSGAIREELGTPGEGDFGAARSNKDYGTGEAPLIFKNGDPVSDMLYTCNFAFFSLNEAYHVTGNKKYGEAVKKLSDFLTRIQVSSKKFRDVNGAWFRAFDYKSWDYWASNADSGWGAWATLTGWIQTWITTTQILVDRDQSYWHLTEGSGINRYMKQTMGAMFKSE